MKHHASSTTYVGKVGAPRTDLHEELQRSLVGTFRSANYTPPMLPAIALELLQLTRNPKVSAGEITALLSQDPMLAAQVLKLSSSAANAGVQPTSLKDAVVRLGLQRVTDLFFRAAMQMRVFRAPGYEAPMAQLNRHSELVAELSAKVCRSTHGFDDYAYLCGLLHDVGLAASILALAEVSPRGGAPSFEDAWPALKQVHEAAGKTVAQLWKLPPDIALVIELHHTVEVQGRAHPIAAAVFVADCVAAEAGVGVHDEVNPERLSDVCNQIGLHRQGLETIRKKAQAWVLSGGSSGG